MDVAISKMRSQTILPPITVPEKKCRRPSRGAIIAIVTVVVLSTLGCIVSIIFGVLHAQHLLPWKLEATTHSRHTKALSSTTASPSSTNRNRSRSCQSDACVYAGRLLSGSIDRQANPCQDFYAYACGNWIKKHPPNAYGSSAGNLGEATAQTTVIIARTLANLPDSAPRYLQLGKTLYDSCRSPTLTRPSSSEELSQMLKELKSFGGWPLIGGQRLWKPGTFRFDAQVGRLAHEGVTTLFRFYVALDVQDVSNYAIHVSPPYSYTVCHQNQSEMNASIFHLAKTFIELLDVDVKEEALQRSVSGIIDFQQLLCKAYSWNDRARAKTNDEGRVRLSALKNISMPGWDWDRMLMNYIGDEELYGKYAKKDPVIILSDLGYLQRLAEALRGKDARPLQRKEVQQNFLLWKLYSEKTSGYGDYGYFDENIVMPDGTRLRPHGASAASELQQNLSAICAHKVISYLPHVATRLSLSDEATMRASKREIQLLTHSILDAVSTIFVSVPWMDAETRLRAIDKVRAYVVNAVAPDNSFDDAFYDALYADLELENGASMDEQRKQIIRWDRKHTADKLLKRPDRSSFQKSAAVGNAFYNPLMNSITIPHGILQLPIYHVDYPKLLQYAMTGAIVGHEISHGFDVEGIEYSGNGTQERWVTEKSANGYKRMTQCVSKEYSKFCPTKDTCLNGDWTVRENVADNAGFKAAYHAYQQFVSARGEELGLPEMEEFTPRQTFFLSFASLWCENQSAEYQRQQRSHDPHSPGKFRVNGVLRNFPPFADEFGCKQGDAMFPTKRCQIW